MAQGNTIRLKYAITGMDCASCALKVKTAVERLPGVSEVHVGVIAERMKLTLDEARTSRDAVRASVRALGYGASERVEGEPRATPGLGEHGESCDDYGQQAQDQKGGTQKGAGDPLEHAVEQSTLSHRISEQSSTAQSSAALNESGSESRPERGHGGADHSDHLHGAPEDQDKPWYQTSRARFVLTTGILLLVATVIDWTVSETLGLYAFIAACLIGLAPVARRAFAALRIGQPFTIESLMTLAAIGALIIGAAEEAALVVFLFAVGEALETVAAGQARAGIKALAALVPTSALLVEGASLREVPAAELAVGQQVLVRPGDRIPADGSIDAGTSGVDESPVTGESVPRLRGPGDPVFAGSINTEAALTITVTRAAADNTIARIVRLVEEAEEARAPTERFIDRFSRWYMPAIVLASALVVLLPPLVGGQDWGTWVYRGLALLLIGCPCALVISVPASIASALSSGARRGLLMKGGAVIEAAAKVSQVAFDKTGTLTHGRPRVTDVAAFAMSSEDQLLSIAAAVETGSSHPLAQAVLARASEAGASVPAASSAKALPGRGVEAVVEGGAAMVVSPRHGAEIGALTEADLQQARALEAEGKTVVTVLYRGQALGLIALRDEPRADAGEAVRQLGEMGIGAVILTGDNPRTAAAIAGGLGMAFRAEMLPEDKQHEIKALAASGGVMMIGDGINDAPALKQASVGVAMGSGTDVALETADAAILRDRVTDVPALIRLARATMRNIRQNVALALGLKAVFLVTSVLGITGLWIAILADTGATVLVTLNALRLLRYRPDQP